jgi:2-octaprenyl-6-methoxyphenol hydroxylase
MNEIKDDGTLAEVITDQGESFKARLLVAADGKNSWVRKYIGIKAHRYDYRQTAIVADISHELPHDGAAIEKFMPQGPFAILPKSDGHSSAIVWTIASENADDIRELSQDDLRSIVFSNFGDYLGELKLLSEIKFFPLELVHAKSYIASRVVLVGDSAHAMHPIAGQGLNLGIRDIKELISLVTEYHELGLDIGSESLLKRYQKNRYPDNNFMLAATHNLNLLFANESRFLRKIRGLGMKMVNSSEVAKKFFMEYASGLISLTR